MIPDPRIASAHQASATRRSLSVDPKKITHKTDKTEAIQTARVLVAKNATGTVKKSIVAKTPRSFFLRNESKAKSPSRFRQRPFATACKKGPRARSAWIPIPSSVMNRGKIKLLRFNMEKIE